MTLKSMLLTKADRKKSRLETKAIGDSGQQYPWGLSLTLDETSLKKLGVKASEFKPGDVVYLACKAKCTSTYASESEKDENSSVSFQVMSMDLKTEADKVVEAFDKVFGDGDKA